MKTTIQKTRITDVSQLKAGDVIYDFEKTQFEKNKTREQPWPVCNFHRVTVVSKVRTLDDGTLVFDTVQHHRLHSNNGDHYTVIEMLQKGVVLTNGSFGCNHRISKHHELYRLDCVKNTPCSGYQPISLKGNPSYDLMM